MATVMVIGATRGIGLELTRQYADAGDEVIACARDKSAAAQLDELASGNDKISIAELDVGNPESIKSAAAGIGDRSIDAVIVMAGVTGGELQSLDDVDLEAWHQAFDTNTIGPMLVARHLKDNLLASGNGHFMIVSSQLGASTWPMGGRYIYSTTKAAVNKVGQILALDWKKDPITVTIVHPGWVQTDMGGPSADITAQESASGLRNVIATTTKADSGNFYKWNGEIHPW